MSNGLIKMCCQMEIPIVDDFGRSQFVGNQPIETVWNSNFLKSARRMMIENREVPVCTNCYQIEDSGAKSLRQEYNDQYLDKNRHIVETAKNNEYTVNQFPSFLELRTGNACNSACRMCNSNDSSLVYIENSQVLKMLKTDPFELSEDDHSQTIVPDPNIIIFGRSEERIDVVAPDIDKYLDEVMANINSIDTITLSGGEPFLLERTADLLELMSVENPNIKLNINTNGSIASDKIINALSKLNDVHLCISIDGYGPVNEYIRYPLKWSKIEKNIGKFNTLCREGFYLSFNVTVQSFNAFDLLNIVKFVGESCPTAHLNLSPLSSPFYMSLQSLPTDIKNIITEEHKKVGEFIINSNMFELFRDELIDSLKGINKFMNLVYTQDNLNFNMFKSNIKVYDKYRNQSIHEFIPEWSKYL